VSSPANGPRGKVREDRAQRPDPAPISVLKSQDFALPPKQTRPALRPTFARSFQASWTNQTSIDRMGRVYHTGSEIEVFGRVCDPVTRALEMPSQAFLEDALCERTLSLIRRSIIKWMPCRHSVIASFTTQSSSSRELIVSSIRIWHTRIVVMLLFRAFSTLPF
jgi:hypothetical protein